MDKLNTGQYNVCVEKNIDWNQIEKGIIPLVRILNNIEGITTQYSCHGHYKRSNAWVIYSCDNIENPYKLRNDVNSLMNSLNSFKYYWSISPYFSFYDGEPGFIIKAIPKVNVLWNRKKLLYKEIDKINDLLFTSEQQKNSKNKYPPTNDNRECSFSFSYSRVFSSAGGASVGIGSDIITTDMTWDLLRHELLYQVLNSKSIKKTISVIAPLENSIVLWNLANELRNLYFEGVYNCWPEITGHFLDERQVLMLLHQKATK